MTQDKSKDLQARIDKLKPLPASKEPDHKDESLAFNLAIELVGGMITGVIIGLGLDNLFDSKPVFLLICLIVAAVAAFRVIWKKYI